MKTPDEQRIPVEAGQELTTPCFGCEKPCDCSINVCAECADKLIERKQPTPDPRIQRVIDAAIALVDSIATRPWFRCEALTPLESALAALGEPTKKKQKCPKCGCERVEYFGECADCGALKEQFKEPTKDDPYPHHYVDSRGKGYQVNSAEHEAGALRLNHKRVSLTAAEAQARMEGKE